MPMLRRLAVRSGNIEDPSTPLSDPAVLRHIPSAGTSLTGRPVSAEGALALSGVYGCVRILSEGISQLDINVTRKEGRVRHPAEDHPAALIVADQPNPEADVGEFWRLVLVWMLLRGNSYVYVQRNGGGFPTALWVLPPQLVRPLRLPESRQIAYQVVLDEDAHAGFLPERSALIPHQDVLHYKAFGLGRLEGLSPVGKMRESIGIAQSAQEYQARFYRNDATPGGYLSTDQDLTDEQFEQLETSWLESHQGLASAHKPAILQGGVKWHSMTLTPGDVDFITSRKWELSEIARYFGVPPHMLGDQERQTSYGTGVDEQNRGFVKHSLMPWASRLERVTRAGLFVAAPLRDRQLYMHFDFDGLLRGDPKTRAEAHAVERQWGWKSINDIRADEGLPPIDGGDGYLEPENMRRVIGEDDVDLRERQRAVEQVSELIRAGFDPDAVAAAYGLDLAHLGLLPATVQMASDERVDPLGHDVEHRVDDQVRDLEVERHLKALRDYLSRHQEGILARATGPRPTSIRDIVDRSRWDDELAGMFRRLASLTAVAYAIGVDDAFDPDDELGGWLAANARIAAEEVNTSTYDAIDARLSEDVDDTVGNVVRATFAVIAAGRAEQIAQARVTTVGQRSQTAAAERSPRISTKTWKVTSSDPRPSHAAVNGETVPVGERFSNGARYPGDPDLDLEDRAGCTCDLTFG